MPFVSEIKQYKIERERARWHHDTALEIMQRLWWHPEWRNKNSDSILEKTIEHHRLQARTLYEKAAYHNTTT